MMAQFKEETVVGGDKCSAPVGNLNIFPAIPLVPRHPLF
jgi:hypothetical protein